MIINIVFITVTVSLINSKNHYPVKFLKKLVLTELGGAIEMIGGDPHSGSVDLAVNELRTDLILWGGHGQGRSFATE